MKEMEKFNLDTLLQDKSRKVVTRDGRPVRIVCTDSPNPKCPIYGFVEGDTDITSWRSDGSFSNLMDSYDLFFADEDERIRKILLEKTHQWHEVALSKRIKQDVDDSLKAIAWLVKQGEQKTTDKVEPKFKYDDWITNGEYTWRIIDTKPLDYILQSPNGDVVDDTISYVDEEFHLWTIQDAKDGDVLADCFGNICIYQKPSTNTYYHTHCYGNHKYFIDGGGSHEVAGTYPATKEQCDLLFQMMKEAGYVWYAEKKELMKIEQNLVWNEEDELMLQRCIADFEYLLKTDKESFMSRYKEQIDWLRFLKGRVQPQPQQEWSEEDEKMKNLIISTLTSIGTINLERYYHMNFDEVENWLKSIKPQSHWKPNEEQMRVLQTAIKDYGVSHEKSVFESLYNDLEKL